MRRLINVCLPEPLPINSDKRLWSIQLNKDDIIESILPIRPESSISGEDWMGDFLSPMAVDLQINGGQGLAFCELTNNDLPILNSLLDRLWKEGVEAIVPTFVTCSVSALRQSLLTLREARKKHVKNRCRLLGAHLEGPFISKEFIGAHNVNYLESPNLKHLDSRIGGFENEIALVTLAPELHGAHEVISRLKELDIVIALGHSSADAETANRAFADGVSMLTHTFNAMPAIHHRSPGPIGEALINRKISFGLIADGVHVHPHMAVLLQTLSANKLVLVSDAIAPYGLSDGKYLWDERFVICKEGTCRLEDGTLVGTTLPLLEGCKRLAGWTGNLGSAIWSATVSPRQVLSQTSSSTHEFLLGESIHKLLRWETNSDQMQLLWQFAS